MAGRREKDERWSSPISLRKAVARAPVFIRLEEGYRGPEESLSFSAEDLMAVEGTHVSNGCRLVLAHYSSEQEGQVDGVYHALMTLPFDHLPDIDVSVLDDPRGDYYRNYVNTNFPDFEWTSLDDDEIDYINIKIITPRPRREPKPAPPSRTSARRPPPPPPDQSDCGASCDSQAPPLPPKPGAAHASSTRSSPYPSLPGDNPPPIPIRPSRKGCSVEERDDIYEVMPDDIDEALCNLPPLAELYISNDASDGVYDVCDDVGEPVQNDPEKKKKGLAGAVVKKVKKAYRAASGSTAQPSNIPPPPSPATSSTGAQKTPDKINREYLELIAEDEDNDDAYEVLDDDTAGTAKEKAGQGRGGQAKKKGGNPAPVQKASPSAAKPTVRVSPQVMGGIPLVGLSRPRSPSDRPPASLPHPLMLPSQQTVSEYVKQEQEVSSPLANLTPTDLALRLQKCGMPDLAKICEEKRLDGNFFLLLTDDDMRKPPFCLGDFELNVKLKMVKAGWMPQT